MCEPVTTALVGTAATGGAAATAGLIGAGGAVTAGGLATAAALTGTVITAKGAMDQGQFSRQMAERNASMQELAGQDAITRGVVAENLQRQQTRQLLARQRASLAANGLDSSFGSALDLMGDTAGMGEFDALTIRSNAYKQAYGLQTQAGNSLLEGSTAKAAGNSRAFSTLLTGGSQAYGMGQKAGLWGAATPSYTKPSMPDFMRGGQ